MIISAFLPFSAIYVELYYVYSSMWSLRVYTLYSILFVVFCILLVVTSFVNVCLTYFQLSSEDPRWWWRSFCCGGATGIFVYGYAVWYWWYRSEMSGLLQGVFFYGYNLIVAYGIFLMLGYVGWRSSLAFVRVMYARIKCE
jgi:transmembrane 9 superfamily protein 1